MSDEKAGNNGPGQPDAGPQYGWRRRVWLLVSLISVAVSAIVISAYIFTSRDGDLAPAPVLNDAAVGSYTETLMSRNVVERYLDIVKSRRFTELNPLLCATSSGITPDQNFDFTLHNYRIVSSDMAAGQVRVLVNATVTSNGETSTKTTVFTVIKEDGEPKICGFEDQ